MYLWVSEVVPTQAPIQSCAGQTRNGVYRMRVNDVDFPVYCEDGWALIMKISQSSIFDWSSPYWTTSETLFADSLSTVYSGDAKLDAFNLLPFGVIRGCVGRPTGNCLVETFAQPWSSARALFSEPQTIIPRADAYESILSTFGVGALRPEGATQYCSPQPDPNAFQYGFNLAPKANEGNARWGLTANQPSNPCTDNPGDVDGAVGFGVMGQDCCPAGAGWTNRFVSNTANNNLDRQAPAWLWVSDTPSTLPQATSCQNQPEGKYAVDGSVVYCEADWTLVMKIAANGGLFYESRLWGRTTEYNTRGPLSLVEGADVIFKPYLDTSFRTIRACVGHPRHNCLVQRFPDSQEPRANARSLFTGATVRESIAKEEFFDARGRACVSRCPPLPLSRSLGRIARLRRSSSRRTRRCARWRSTSGRRAPPSTSSAGTMRTSSSTRGGASAATSAWRGARRLRAASLPDAMRWRSCGVQATGPVQLERQRRDDRIWHSRAGLLLRRRRLDEHVREQHQQRR